MEIEYGTLIHRNNVLFYFRELEGAVLEEKFGMEHIQDTFAGEKVKMRKLKGRLSELCLSFQNRSQSLVLMIDAVDQLLVDSDREKMILLRSV